MQNQQIELALQFHQGTSHPAGALMNPYHRYTYEMEPLKQKIYVGLPTVNLPEPVAITEQPALAALASVLPPFEDHRPVNKTLLSNLLHYSAGVTKTIKYPQLGEIPFRAAACTGALYHIELYVVCAELEDLAAGVYHYDPLDHVLTRLRQGDYRRVVHAATAEQPAVSTAQALLVYTDMPIRNALKYQARAYRHAFWDSGTILANTLALAAEHQLPAQLILGFEDARINDLLHINGWDEFALALLPIGVQRQAAPEVEQPLSVMDLPVRPVTHIRIDLTAIEEIHRASSLENTEQVAGWRLAADESRPIPGLPEPTGQLVPLPDAPKTGYPETLAEVIIRRGSTRQFSQAEIGIEQLGAALQLAYQPLPADFLPLTRAGLSEAYVIVNAVTGVPGGAYVYHPERHALERIVRADLRNTAGFLALGQDLGRDASANIYFLAHLEPILARFGNRGYRAAQLDASLRAGRIYLAAYAMRFGATGLTFYDDEVVNFFSPHAVRKSVMFLIALGQRASH
jgi:SagB-type dehydrogenase family enzyme